MSGRLPVWFPNLLQQEAITACVSESIMPDRLPVFFEAGQDDPAIRRLFPLLYHNLKLRGIDHPLIRDLKGHYRQAWFANQRLLYESERVLQLLNEQSIPTMFLKGAALLLTCYDSHALRPMSDIDVLVPDSDAMRAYGLLASQGWHMTEADRAPRSRFALIPGINLEDQAGNAIDLHWFAIWQNCTPGADARFWQRALMQDVNGVPVRVPGSEDNLLHTLIHGARWNAIAPIRWITDALAILQHASSFDWLIFVDEARQRGLSAALVELLAYLQSAFDAPIPADVLQSLGRASESPGERLESALRRRQRSEWRGLKFHVYNLIRLNRRRVHIGPLRYLREWWGRPLLHFMPKRQP